MTKRAKNHSNWFRFYAEVLDDPKVQGLSDKIYRTWIGVLCIARRNGGLLPSMKDVAFLLRISEKEAKARISELIGAGLIDRVGDDRETRLSPHNWEIRQYDSDVSTARVRAFRERQNGHDETFLKRKRNVSFSASASESESVSGLPIRKKDRESRWMRELCNNRQAFDIELDIPSLD